MNDIKKSYYAIIPANVRYDKDLIPNAKLLYGEITALCNDKGYCWASNSYFAELYEVSIRSITNWIAQLDSKDYIRTKLIYKENSKEVKERRIYIGRGIEEIFHTPRKKLQGGIEEIFHTPIEENFQDNNTSFNNTVNNTNNKVSKDTSSTKVQPIIDKWNELNLSNLVAINQGTNRYKLTQARIKEHGIDKLLEAIESINKSSFLKGQNSRGWIITYDWLVKPNNFLKVLEGNYLDKGGGENGNGVPSDTGKGEETIDWAARAGVKSF